MDPDRNRLRVAVFELRGIDREFNLKDERITRLPVDRLSD